MEDIYNTLIAEGFERIERDDRMLDIFPHETREKGIELWDKWNEETVEITRIHLPKGEKSISRYTFKRNKIESALFLYQKLELKDASSSIINEKHLLFAT